MKPLLFLGCIVISIFFISSGYDRLQNPDSYIQTFQSFFSQINSYTEQIGLAFNNMRFNIKTIVKAYGLFEILIALLIITEDYLGGLFGMVVLTISFFKSYFNHLITLNILKLGGGTHMDLLKQLGLIGVCFLLTFEMCKNNKQKQ